MDSPIRQGEYIMNRLSDSIVKFGNRLLEPNFNDRILLGGPLWLLWYGNWREALRNYLPLTFLFVTACSLLCYGLGHRNIMLFQLGNIGIIVCLLAGFAINIFLYRRWNKTPDEAGKHIVLPLLWVAGLFLLLSGGIWLGSVL